MLRLRRKSSAKSRRSEWTLMRMLPVASKIVCSISAEAANPYHAAHTRGSAPPDLRLPQAKLTENRRSFDPADPSCLGTGCVSVRTDIGCDRRKSLQDSRNG